MTGIIMAGRTGAAFAAQLGTMKVTQEIDALTTMGISPDGVSRPAAGRRAVRDDAAALPVRRPRRHPRRRRDRGRHARSTLDLTFHHAQRGAHHRPLRRRLQGVRLRRAGRRRRLPRGMQCGSSASAVGEAATSAVVTGIVLIVWLRRLRRRLLRHRSAEHDHEPANGAAAEAHINVRDLTMALRQLRA